MKQIVRDTPEFVNSFIWYETPLHYAVRENRIDVVRELLAAGINPGFSNFTYSSWQKLLPMAEERGCDEVHMLLVAEMRKRFNYQPGYEQLCDAVVAGDVDEVRKLISSEPDRINAADEHGNRPIHWAIIARHIPVIQLLLDNGADINAKRADGQSPLHLAVSGYDYWFNKKDIQPGTPAWDVARFIRDQGADYEFTVAVAFNDLDHVKNELAKDPGLANRLNDARRSPLNFAASRGHLQMVGLLLDHGANPNQPEHCADRGSALFAASSANNIELMKLLLEHGADADAYVDSSGNCLSIAAGGPRESEAIELLKQNNAQPGEWTLDSLEKVSAAMEDETFVPNRDAWSSILGKILGHDDVELLEKYVGRYGSDTIRDLNPANGWHLPASKEMVEAMLKHGADVNARDWFARTYLHYLAGDDWCSAVNALVDAGINIDAIDHQSGTTALGLAAKSGNLKMVEFLLGSGADPDRPECQWAKPLTLARAGDHIEVVERLQQAMK